MKASFAQRDVPLFLSLASRYAPLSVIEPARKALKVFASGYNQGLIYDETVDSNIPAISTLLNIIAQNLKAEANCTFFDDHSIEFGLLPSYQHALDELTKFKETPKKPYGIQTNKYLVEDLFNIVSVISACKEFRKIREEIQTAQKEYKMPVIKEVAAYEYLFGGVSSFALMFPSKDDPVINSHNLIKNGLKIDTISEDNFNLLHGYLEKILNNGWSYYYKQIKVAYSSTVQSVRYTTILKKLEIVGQNISNVSLIGRHNRQVSAIDLINNFNDESHRKMMFELQSFLGNAYSFFLAYNYLSQRVHKSMSYPQLDNEMIYTWTCGFCNKKFGRAKAVVLDHSIMIKDADGMLQKATCPGKKHPPLEIGDSGLSAKAENEKSLYKNAVLELNALDRATSLLVVGKHSNRIFTPKDLSWNDRLNTAKAEKQATVDQLKAVHEQTEKELSEWEPIPIAMVPLWTGSKKKVA